MNRKEYELIAGVLKYTVPDLAHHESAVYKQWEWIMHSLAETLEKNYDNFNRDKFLKACGIEETK